MAIQIFMARAGLVTPRGFEPPTNSLGNYCSIRAELRGHSDAILKHRERCVKFVVRVPWLVTRGSGFGTRAFWPGCHSRLTARAAQAKKPESRTPDPGPRTPNSSHRAERVLQALDRLTARFHGRVE